jgi:hypothetical protein
MRMLQNVPNYCQSRALMGFLQMKTALFLGSCFGMWLMGKTLLFWAGVPRGEGIAALA